MSNIGINQINLVIPTAFGEVTERKQNVAFDILKEKKFNGIIRDQNGTVVILSDLNENVSISLDRISYSKQGNNIDVERVRDVLSSLIDAFMLDFDMFGFLDIQGTSRTENSHNESVSLFNKKYNAKLDGLNVYGVGYRFLISDELGEGEFKVEPLINNKLYNFHQVIFHINKRKVSLDELFSKLEGIIANIDQYNINIE
ncbi:hypothetical protein [Clostridium sp. YIM B02506]|uniref:hypothetical protein n=1 Tax=Clostridium sp. YIM B02506 TaxID=2910680 RepID=UPI001EEE805F|nr:hypothetical protein [Clostridium sp. YIM B02506]